MSGQPYDPDAPPHYQHPTGAAARERILFPAIFLLVVGVINFFFALFFTLGGFVYKAVPVGQIEKIMAAQNAKQWDEMQRNGFTAQSIKDLAVRWFFSGAGCTGLVAVLILIGAVRMIQLRSYGMAVTGSLLSVIPCLSPSSCLMLGVFAGVWALVVLLDPDVREVFA